MNLIVHKTTFHECENNGKHFVIHHSPLFFCVLPPFLMSNELFFSFFGFDVSSTTKIRYTHILSPIFFKAKKSFFDPSLHPWVFIHSVSLKKNPGAQIASSSSVFLVESPHPVHPPPFSCDPVDVIFAWYVLHPYYLHVLFHVSFFFEMECWFRFILQS